MFWHPSRGPRPSEHHGHTVGNAAAEVSVTDLHKAYGGEAGPRIVAADHIDLLIPPGSVVALTGSSGSGKSTLLHLIAGIDRPDAGSITVGETVVTGLSARRLAEYRRTVGFVFQRYNLLPALSALDNVLAPVLPYRTDYDKQTRARELLDAVGLAGRENSLPSRLSGGQQQRVAIARALINRPRLLLADEPTGNLDTTTGQGVLELLLGLRDRTGATVILATHDPAIAEQADRRIILRDGSILSDG